MRPVGNGLYKLLDSIRLSPPQSLDTKYTNTRSYSSKQGEGDRKRQRMKSNVNALQ